jgi:hypothetical protein
MVDSAGIGACDKAKRMPARRTEHAPRRSDGNEVTDQPFGCPDLNSSVQTRESFRAITAIRDKGYESTKPRELEFTEKGPFKSEKISEQSSKSPMPDARCPPDDSSAGMHSQQL